MKVCSICPVLFTITVALEQEGQWLSVGMAMEVGNANTIPMMQNISIVLPALH
jgi:hypothetical protein